MTQPRINKIEVQGFRAYGKDAQTLTFGGPIAAVWGPNSQGKTSLAEAFEFLLTGQIIRRQLMASTQAEFADALRNVHMPPATPVFVRAEITGSDGKSYTLKRTLTSDYAKRQDCQSKLEIDGNEANEDGLSALGIVLSQPPLAAPVLAQHTLGYLFSARPQDRATYFKTTLEVTDLEKLRTSAAELENEIISSEDPTWNKLIAAVAIPKAQDHIMRLKTTVPGKNDIAAALDDAVAAILTAAGADVPATAPKRVAALEKLLASRRKKTFPVDEFQRKALADWTYPGQLDWDKLDTYIQERAKVDKETRRLAALFTEALAIPAVADATDPIDCLLCGAEKSLSPERVFYLRTRLQETEAFQAAERDAINTLRRLKTLSESLVAAVVAACPGFLNAKSKDRRKSGFRLERIRALLSDEDKPVVGAWLPILRVLARARTSASAQASSLTSTSVEYIEKPYILESTEDLRQGFAEVAKLYAVFKAALPKYVSAESKLVELLTTVIDSASDTADWQDLIDLAGDPDGLRNTLIERHARTTLQKELADALRQIDKGNEKVLDDKFAYLSAGIQNWWNLLRPDESTFFSAVKPRKGARRTVDFKAGLSLHADRSASKLRDVIAVFSQSQLHCLGLALFIARSVHEGTGFMILDDPILASDEDYRAYFKFDVLKNLIDAGIQVIVLTQDQKSWKDLEDRYMHNNIDMFQIELADPANGTSIYNKGDGLKAMISRIKVLVNGGHAYTRKQAGELLRNAVERFCKMMLVNDRLDRGDTHAAISDYDGKNLGQIRPQVELLLTGDPSHPGKLRSLSKGLNSAKHDEGTPDRGTLKVALGDLCYLNKKYLAS